MRKGDKVVFNGRIGTIEGFMPKGMVDVRFEGADFIERRSAGLLRSAVGARENPRSRPNRRARRNAGDPRDEMRAQLESTLTVTQLKAKAKELGVALVKSDNKTTIARKIASAIVGSSPPRELSAQEREDEKAELERLERITRIGTRASSQEKEGDTAKTLEKFRKELRFENEPRSLAELHKIIAEQRLQGEAEASGETEREMPSGIAATRRVPQAEQLRAVGDALRYREAPKKVSRAGSQTTITPGKREEELSEVIRGAGAAVFTRADPPRMSADRSSYCGNPIDSTAYFIAVDNAAKASARWITWEEVAKASGLKNPTKEALRDFFPKYVKTLEYRRGVQVTGSSIGPNQLIRLRQPKVLGRDHIKAEKGGRAQGQWPDLENDFCTITTGPLREEVAVSGKSLGSAVYYRKYERVARQKKSMDSFFQAFRYRQARIVERAPLHEALIEAFRGETPITSDIAHWLILGGAVAVGGGRGKDNKPQVIMDPSWEIAAGEKVSIWLKDKQASPFFSWVPTTVPDLRVDRGSRRTHWCDQCGHSVETKNTVCPSCESKRPASGWPGSAPEGVESFRDSYPKCLSADEMALKVKLNTSAKIVGELSGAYNSVRSLIRRLALVSDGLKGETSAKTKDATYPSDVRRSLEQLGRAWASFFRMTAKLSEAQDEGSKLLSDVLWSEDSPLTNELFVPVMDSLLPGGPLASLQLILRPDKEDAQSVLSAEVTGGPAEGYIRLMNRLSGLIKKDAALTFLEGGDVHPCADLYHYAMKDSDPELEVLLQEAQSGNGISKLRTCKIQDYDDGELEQLSKKDSEKGLLAAIEFRKGVCEELRQGNVGTGRQADMDWTLCLIIGDVLPAMMRAGKKTSSETLTLVRELVLLTRLYYAMGGYQLAGPLNPENERQEAASLLAQAKQYLRNTEAQLMGGSTSLGSTGNFTIYMTYNPILFEFTRLYWPTRDARQARGLLASNKLLHDLDAVGRYGVAATKVQEAAVYAGSEDEVCERLEASVSNAANQTPTNLLRGKTVIDPETDEEVPVEDTASPFKTFDLLWPLGKNVSGAFREVANWFTDPLGYLMGLKADVEEATGRLFRVRSVGLQKQLHATDSGYVREIQQGEETPIDPLENINLSEDPERYAAAYRLRQLLARALPKDPGFDALPEKERKRAESAALKRFQSAPGQVQERASSGARPRELRRVPATGVYDAPTIALLEEKELSAHPPRSGISFWASERKPSVGRTVEEDRGKKGKEKVRQQPIQEWSGGADIYRESLLQKAAATEINALLSSIEEGIAVLDREINKKKGTPARDNRGRSTSRR